MCNCGAVNEATIHYHLRCQLYSVKKAKLLDGIYKLDSTLQNSSEDQLLTFLLYGSEKFALNVNKEIIRLTISYFRASEHFVQRLFWPTTFVFFYIYMYIYIYIFFLFLMSDCTGLDYILLEFCLLFRPQF